MVVKYKNDNKMPLKKMEKIGSIPTPALTDREILLLTYQQLQNVSEEFRNYKTSTDMALHDLQVRMSQIEQHMSTAEAVKEDAEKRSKRQMAIIGTAFTIVNMIISGLIQFILKLRN